MGNAALLTSWWTNFVGSDTEQHVSYLRLSRCPHAAWPDPLDPKMLVNKLLTSQSLALVHQLSSSLSLCSCKNTAWGMYVGGKECACACTHTHLQFSLASLCCCSSFLLPQQRSTCLYVSVTAHAPIKKASVNSIYNNMYCV